MTDQCNCDQSIRLRAELLKMCSMVEDVDNRLLWKAAPTKDGRDSMAQLVIKAQEIKARLDDE